MSTEAVQGVPEPAVYDFISSMGNHEVKGAVLAAMRPKVAYTLMPLLHEVMALQGDHPVWNLSKRTPHNFCMYFAQIGLVAEETVGTNAARAYRLTERGAQLAKPTVGHLFNLSLTEKQPLVDIYGPTATTSARGIRPSQNRIDLMRFLLSTDGQVSPVGRVGAALGLEISHAGNIVDDMASAELLTVESSGRGKPTIRFTAGPGFQEVTLRPRQSADTELLGHVTAVLQRHFAKKPEVALSNAEIVELLIEAGHYEAYSPGLMKGVSDKTNYLTHKRQVLIAERDRDEPRAREVVHASPAQLETMARAVKIVDSVMQPTDEYLEQGSRLLAGITADSDLVKRLVQKAMDSSVGRKANADEQDAIKSTINSALAAAAEPLSVNEIHRLLTESGQKLDRSTVSNHMRLLRRAGSVAVTETIEGNKYAKLKG